MPRIAVAQLPGSPLSDWSGALSRAFDAIDAAARDGAELIVLPEGAWPTYWIGSRDKYARARASGMPGTDHFLKQIAAAACDAGIHVCTGFLEESGGALRNSAVLIDPDGRELGRYAKSFLWDFDREFFVAGRELPVFETRIGRIGILICADARIPEIPATLAARGAQLIVQPTAWVNGGGPDELWNPQPDYLIPTRARELGVPIASATKWGREGDTVLVGGSLVCDAAGGKLAQAGVAETRVVAASVELGGKRRPHIVEEDRAAVLSRAAPRRPRSDVPNVSVVFGGEAERVGSTPSASDALRIRVRPNVTGPAGGEPRVAADAVLIDAPFAGVVEHRGVGVSAVAPGAVGHFAAVRARALSGAHVVFVLGECDEGPLRTRATENRLFVVSAGREQTRFVAPNGRVQRQALSTPLLLDVSLAADKRFAPGTDAFEGRVPELYEL